MTDIPTDWVATTIGESADFLTGFPFASSKFSDTGIRLVRGSNVKRAVLDWTSDISRFWPKDEPALRPLKLREGDVVIAMDGALVGRSYARIRRSDLPAYLVQRVARLRGTSVAQGLLYQWVGSDRFVQHVDSVKTHTAIPHISPHDIREFPISIPSDPLEQKRIGDALADADELITAVERMIVKKHAIKQGLMQQLLTGRARLPGYTVPWVNSTVADLARVTGGGTPSTRVSTYWGGNIPWFTPAEIDSDGSGLVSHSHRTITSEGLANSAATLLPAGTVLVTSRASIGNCAVAAVPVATNQGFASLIPKDLRSTWFLYYWMQQNRSELEARAAGSTFLEISAGKVAAISLVHPSPGEQEAIGSALHDADRVLQALGLRLAKVHHLKQGMMQELLTGRTRLPVKEAAA